MIKLECGNECKTLDVGEDIVQDDDEVRRDESPRQAEHD